MDALREQWFAPIIVLVLTDAADEAVADRRQPVDDRLLSVDNRPDPANQPDEDAVTHGHTSCALV
jgi:hypothetical protein